MHVHFSIADCNFPFCSTLVQCKCFSTQQCAHAQWPRDKTYTGIRNSCSLVHVKPLPIDAYVTQISLIMFVPVKKKHGIHITSTCTIAIMTPWYLIDTQVWYFYSCNSVIPRSNKNIISASQFQSIFKQTVHIINLRKKIINKSDIVSIQEVSMYMYWF